MTNPTPLVKMSNMTQSRLYFFIGFVLSAGLAFWLFRPFIVPILLALVFAIIFKPLDRQIIKAVKIPSLSAGLTMIVILFIVLVPATLLGIQIFREGVSLYQDSIGPFLANNNVLSGDLSFLPTNITDKLNNIEAEELTKAGSSILAWFLPKAGAILGSSAKLALSLFIFVLSLFYFIRDSVYFRKLGKNLSPLSEDTTDQVIGKLSLTINSIVRGVIFVAILQGIAATIGFFAFSVPNPFLLGAAVFIAALLPGVGISFIFGPVIVYLLATDAMVSAGGIFIWSILAVGLIDNLLGPILISKKADIHPLFILVSILSGLAAFGPAGFLIGPLILALFLSLLPAYDKYKTE